MNLDKLKKAQEYVDKRMSNFETEDRRSHEDTAAAIAHLDANLNFYLRQVENIESGLRNKRIIKLVRHHFENADINTLRDWLNKKFIFTVTYFFCTQLVFHFLLCMILYFIKYVDSDSVVKIIYFAVYTIISLIIIGIMTIIYHDCYWMNFYRVKKSRVTDNG